MRDMVKGMLMGLALVMIVRRRARAEYATDDGVTPSSSTGVDPLGPFLEQLGKNAPALFALVTTMQSDQRRNERRETARQDAFAWRELALRCSEASQHGAADRALLHAEQIERQHQLVDEPAESTESDDPTESDDDEPTQAAAPAASA